MSASKQAERLVIEIRNLTEAQAIAIEDMLATWVELGGWGASRWTAFYADGDGNFRPKIIINGRKPEKTRLLPNDATWPDGFHGDYKIDFDTVAWRLGQEREGLTVAPMSQCEHCKRAEAALGEKGSK